MGKTRIAGINEQIFDFYMADGPIISERDDDKIENSSEMKQCNIYVLVARYTYLISP